MRYPRIYDRLSATISWLAILLICALSSTVSAQHVIVHFKSGDRVSGHVVSRSTSQLVISNAWVKALTIPLSTISKIETNAAALAVTSPKETPAKKPGAAAKPAAKPVAPKLASGKRPKPKGKFKGQIRFGIDAIFHTKNRQDYFGDFKLTYQRPYKSNPKKFFRDTTQVHAEYQETEGQQSANRASASNKSDFDVGRSFYAYGLGGLGYDEVRKINFQYQLGPGVGNHLVKHKNFVLDVESGLNYEAQYRRTVDNLETLYLRLGLDSTWKIAKNLKLTHTLAFYPDLEEQGQFRNDFTSNLSYGFWKNISLDLTLLDEFNTEVAPGVDENRFEVRTSIGLTF